MTEVKENWGSRVGLILAMAGNAVGLGNFLRFPIKAVQNGGGEFIIPYLVCFLLMGLPLLFVEWGMGRYGGKFGDHSTPFILDNMTKRKFWKYFGVFGIFTNFGVIAYYTYIESWTLAYVWESIKGTFIGMDINNVSHYFDQYVDINDGVINLPWKALSFFVVILAINIWILSKGLSGGVEKAAKIAMPLLLIFGAFLAFKGLSMGNTGACADCDATMAFNFLWEPNFNGLWNFKTWLEAAGQVFFTLSVGMGTIQCYASYIKYRDDIALNAMSAGWMNEFVEIVLGASVVIPIAVGYLGMEWVQNNAGFMMAFKTMPYLFDQWGAVSNVIFGVFWFGLLFFAGVTSSLAMGTPWMGFMEHEFEWGRKKSAIVFGIIVFILALPTILFFQQGVFDEYDYWTGTVSLVVFALAEVILFGWIFGIDKAWKEITHGADIRVPIIFKFFIKWVTPIFIMLVFIGALIKPKNDDWGIAWNSLTSGNGWIFDKGSILHQLFRFGEKTIWFENGHPTGTFFIDMSRLLLVLTFAGIAYLVHIASKRRENKIPIEHND
ncbi:MAG TPA: sodium:calcium symporter [Flavobacteriales bacterium]|nr:sodium:calcium symporter [Flavobacteriales bacterium]